MTELETMVARLYLAREAWRMAKTSEQISGRAKDVAACKSGAALRAVLREGKQLVAQMAIDRERQTKGTG